jgi:hypothetical protein
MYCMYGAVKITSRNDVPWFRGSGEEEVQWPTTFSVVLTRKTIRPWIKCTWD